MQTCFECKKEINEEDNYIYHTEVMEDFCSHTCADKYDRVFRQERTMYY